MVIQQISKVLISPLALMLVALPVFIINVYQNVLKHSHKL